MQGIHYDECTLTDDDWTPTRVGSPFGLENESDSEDEDDDHLSCWFGGRDPPPRYDWRVLDVQPKMAIACILDADMIERTRVLHMHSRPSLMASCCTQLTRLDYDRIPIYLGLKNHFATEARCVAFFAKGGHNLVPVEMYIS